MQQAAPKRPKTAHELKRRAIAIHEHGRGQVPTFTQFCYVENPKKRGEYKYSASVVDIPDGYKSQWVVMPNAAFMPAPDLRDWHMSEVRIFVLDAAQLDLKFKCTHKDKKTGQDWCNPCSKRGGWS